MRILDEGVWRDVARARVYVDGAWREMTEVQVREDNAWSVPTELIDDLTLSLSRPSLQVIISGSGLAATQPVTANPAGGRGPFTYQWERVNGVFANITAPQAATTQFSFFLTSDRFFEGIYRCTVTDALGAQASQNVSVTFESIPSFGR